MTRDLKILRCPFCGEDQDGGGLSVLDHNGFFYVYCFGCGGRSGVEDTVQLAIESWNKRSIEDLKKTINNNGVKMLIDIEIESRDKKIKELKDKIHSFYKVIEHGDNQHRAWLLMKFMDHFIGIVDE